MNSNISHIFVIHILFCCLVVRTGDMSKISKTQVSEGVEQMSYFVINFWGKKLIEIAIFTHISQNQKFWGNSFLSNGFWPGKW